MKFLTNTLVTVTKAALKAALVVALMFGQSFFIRAQESTQRIYYRFDNAVVDPAYLSNAEAFSAIDAVFASGHSEALEIATFSSPEGNFNYNLNLSTRRAKAIAKYLVARYPQLDGKISVNPNAEAWEALRAAVVADSRLSESAKAAMLQIIDSNDSADAKEKKLSALQSWKYLYSNYFRTLRYAEIRFTGPAAEGTDKADVAALDAILFDINSVEVDRNFGTNAQFLDNLAATIHSLGADGIDSIEIVAQASLDGSLAENELRAAKRAQAAREYIVARFPELEGKIATRTEWKHASEDVLPGIHQASVSIKKAGKAEDGVQPASDQSAKDTVKRAIPTSTEAVFFDLNSVSVDRNYGTNGEALDELISLIESRGTDEIESIEILAKTSPDGTVTVNERCAKQRGQAVYDYIVARYPELKNKVTVRSAGEAWEDLKAAVESDEELSDSSRSKILSIIVSPADPDEKEARMRELPEWEHLLNEVFPSLRNARAEVKHKEAPAEPAMPTAQPADITVDDEPIVVADTTLRLTEDVLNIAPAPAVKYPRFAVSTNLVYDLFGVTDGFRFTPNVSLEFPIGNKWSTFIDYAFPWWVTKGNNQAWQILKWDIGSRYWLSRHNSKVPMDILSGHFVGIDLGAGYYDIEPKHKGWQGEFQTVGIEYGYAWKLGQAWRLDAYVGAGWLGTHYRYYVGDSTDQHLLYRNHGKMTWLGPTKAGISIKYIFNTERRNGR